LPPPLSSRHPYIELLDTTYRRNKPIGMIRVARAPRSSLRDHRNLSIHVGPTGRYDVSSGLVKTSKCQWLTSTRVTRILEYRG